MANTSDILKNKRVLIIGGSILGLILIAVAAMFLVPGLTGGGGDTAAAPPPTTAANPAAPGGPGAPGGPKAPGAVPTPAPSATQLAKAQARQTMNSWAGAPAGYGGVGTDATGGAPAPGAPGAAAGGTAGGGGPLDALKPIQRGMRVQNARPDPFISYRIQPYQAPPAWTFVAPIRLASVYRPPVPSNEQIDPDLRFGPLPPVERRVAGVLYDGSVSAILETGTPGGAGTDVRVIQPGATVPSGIPGIDDLTVASISPTKVVLRAGDGRTVGVNLSVVPAAFADAFHQSVSGNGGGAPAAPGGPPPGFGAGGKGRPGTPVSD